MQRFYFNNVSGNVMVTARNHIHQEPFGIRIMQSAKENFFLNPGVPLSPRLP